MSIRNLTAEDWKRGIDYGNGCCIERPLRAFQNPYAVVEADFAERVEEQLSKQLGALNINLESMMLERYEVEDSFLGGPRTLKVTLTVQLNEPIDYIVLDVAGEGDEEKKDNKCSFDLDGSIDCSIGRTEVSGEVVNQLRDAVFAIEKELGIKPKETPDEVLARLHDELEDIAKTQDSHWHDAKRVDATDEAVESQRLNDFIDGFECVTLTKEDKEVLSAELRLDESTKADALIVPSFAGVDMAVTPNPYKVHNSMYSKAVAEIQAIEDARIFGILDTIANGGVTCKKCNTLNEYCNEPNQSDGTHICYSCKSGW